MIGFEKIKRSIDEFLASVEFDEIYKAVIATVKKHSMLPSLKKGALIGFSGGADSVMAALTLKKLSLCEDFELACLHVNHGIRGSEADRDEDFSRTFCEAIGIRFYCEKVDVPAYSKEKGVSLELGARELRYEKFTTVTKESDKINTIVTAHNATDNLETVIFNLARGTGTLGLSGIAPVRENIVRPLIDLPKAKITEALDKYVVPYMIDSTNNSNEYTRNFIRHEILPMLRKLNESVENTTLRLGENLRSDNECLVGISRSFFDENYKNGRIDRAALSALHKSLFTRVLALMSAEYTFNSPEKCHSDKIYSMLKSDGDFSIDIQSGLRFTAEGNVCKIVKKEECVKAKSPEEKILSLGINELPDYECLINISYDKNDNISSNVYKISTQASIPNDIIIGDLRVRPKKDGDSYIYGGMTRKIKKLFNDKKIPQRKREIYPIICDDKGILFVPRFGIRDSETSKNGKKLYVSIYEKYE